MQARERRDFFMVINDGKTGWKLKTHSVPLNRSFSIHFSLHTHHQCEMCVIQVRGENNNKAECEEIFRMRKNSRSPFPRSATHSCLLRRAHQFTFYALEFCIHQSTCLCFKMYVWRFFFSVGSYIF